jgi:SAM-dependent methyltransferase
MARACPACGTSGRHPFASKGGYEYHRCDTCGLLLLEPLPSVDVIEAHYRQKFTGGNYQAIRDFADAYRSIYEEYVTWMARHVALPGAKVLDVGCFTGDLVDALCRAGADAYGVELQREAVEIASARLPGRVFQQNIDDSYGLIQDHAFDAVTAMAIIEHVTGPQAILERCRALLKPGGWLFLETPDASSLPARLARSHWPPLAPVEHIHLFSRDAMRRCLQRAGFEVVSLSRHVKRLPIDYVYRMLDHFGPEWKPVVAPVKALLPGPVRRRALPFYVGEMLVAARATGGAAGTRAVEAAPQ